MNIVELIKALRTSHKGNSAEMKVVYALEPVQKSIFLAGPTPRQADVKSWRPEALEILRSLRFRGDVYVPEARDWGPHDHYDLQVNWEWQAIDTATVVVFWVPRDLETMPAFTTNVEFGYLVSSGKVVLGFPQDAPKMSYLKRLAEKHGVTVCHTLEETLKKAVAVANAAIGRSVLTSASSTQRKRAGD